MDSAVPPTPPTSPPPLYDMVPYSGMTLLDPARPQQATLARGLGIARASRRNRKHAA